jgi:histidinol-phosphatase (PHP family)
MCREAIAKGLKYICFTDHIEHNPADEGYRYLNFDLYLEAIERVKDEFGDKINILKGIEFSEPHVYPREFEKFLARDLDVVIGSIHYIGNIGLHYFDRAYAGSRDDLRDYTREKVYDQYYRELLETVKLGGFDILAHFDNPKRYLKEPCLESETIDDILCQLVAKGIALEINTSPLRRGYHETAPGAEILRRFVAAGGKRVTIGSDAHCCREIAADLDYAFKLAQENHGTVGIFKGRRFVPADRL